MIYWFAVSILIASAAGAPLYRRIWVRLRKDGTTPTGYGAFTAVVILLTALAFRAPADVVRTAILIAIVTAVYWFDDVCELHAGFRALLQFATGAAIAYLLLAPSLGIGFPLVLACLAAGIFNLGMTNIVNFYDGADLNLAAFLILTCIAVLLASPANAFLGIVALAVFAFVVPFAVVNSKPKALYFGDAGCFAFANLLTAGTILSFRGSDGFAAFGAIPVILPIFDALYVLVLRMARKEDLLTRNYLHLYQQLQSRYGNFAYLAPQFVAALLILAATQLFYGLGISPLASTAVAGLVVTPAFYFACRRVFLVPENRGANT